MMLYSPLAYNVSNSTQSKFLDNLYFVLKKQKKKFTLVKDGSTTVHISKRKPNQPLVLWKKYICFWRAILLHNKKIIFDRLGNDKLVKSAEENHLLLWKISLLVRSPVTHSNDTVVITDSIDTCHTSVFTLFSI